MFVLIMSITVVIPNDGMGAEDKFLPTNFAFLGGLTRLHGNGCSKGALQSYSDASYRGVGCGRYQFNSSTSGDGGSTAHVN